MVFIFICPRSSLTLSLSQYPLVLTHLTQVRLTKENQNETENEELLETLHDDVGCGEEKE